jgi:hypothetical protein
MLSFILCLLTCGTSLAQTKAADGVQNAADGIREVSVANMTAEAASTDAFRRALKRLRPQLRFDSGEDFFPLSVSAITNNVGNRLVREFNNQTIAERLPGGKELRIGYLHGGGKYPNGDDILNNDKVIERHQSKDDYFEDAAKLQADSRYGNRIYGRLILTRDDGRVTGAWLQYWLYYYYNDFPYGPTGGDHEGDWELVQIKLDANAVPVYAVYSHHGKASKCGWSQVRKERSRPIVYVALGSHANYFRAGVHGHDLSNDGGKHRDMRRLITIGSNSPRWLNWPGFWGGTKAEGPFGANSPRGPKMQKKMWDPDIFAGEAEAADDCNN